MELRTIETTVTPEAHDVGVALREILDKAEESTRDGFQAAEDLSSIVMGSFGKLQEALKGASKIGAEAKAAPMALSRAVLVPVTEGVEEWVQNRVIKADA